MPERAREHIILSSRTLNTNLNILPPRLKNDAHNEYVSAARLALFLLYYIDNYNLFYTHE